MRRNGLARIHLSIIYLWYMILKDMVKGLGSLEDTSQLYYSSSWLCYVPSPASATDIEQYHLPFALTSDIIIPLPTEPFKCIAATQDCFACPAIVCQSHTLLQAVYL